MSETQFPTGMPVIGADPELKEKLCAELNSIRGRKRTEKAVQAAFSDPTGNRRESVRYEVAIPAVCYPITVSNEVDKSASLDAIVGDISKTGMMLMMDAAQPYVGLELIVGVERPGGTSEFAAGTVVASKRNSRGLVEARIRFGGYMHEMLQNDFIIPVLDRTQMQFGLPYPNATLASLCKVGAAASEVLDTVLVCPHCQANPDGSSWMQPVPIEQCRQLDG